ncbi:MAG: hypothetical protein SGI97_06750 [candidate division Zixibacteria bacterium]|nr:hypothetical protein [candidate division Zixibacteria bacterium]
MSQSEDPTILFWVCAATALLCALLSVSLKESRRAGFAVIGMLLGISGLLYALGAITVMLVQLGICVAAYFLLQARKTKASQSSNFGLTIPQDINGMTVFLICLLILFGVRFSILSTRIWKFSKASTTDTGTLAVVTELIQRHLPHIAAILIISAGLFIAIRLSRSEGLTE